MDMSLLAKLYKSIKNNEPLDFDRLRVSYKGDLNAELRKLARAGYISILDGADDDIYEFDMNPKGYSLFEK